MTGGQVCDRMQGARRLNNGAIPWAFTDLVAAALQCLPSGAPRLLNAPHLREELRQALDGAADAGAACWPEPARALFERLREIAEDAVPVLPAGLIGPALDVVWPTPATGKPAWLRRADCGEGE